MSVITSAKYSQRNIVNVTVEIFERLMTDMFPYVSETISLTSAEFGRFSFIYLHANSIRNAISFVFPFISSLLRKTIFAN